MRATQNTSDLLASQVLWVFTVSSVEPWMLTPHVCYAVVTDKSEYSESTVWWTVHTLQGLILDISRFFPPLMFQWAIICHRKLILHPSVQVFYNLKINVRYRRKTLQPRGWSSFTPAIWISSEELGVESMYNFCCRSNLCCSVMWVITTNQSWRLPHFPLHFPPGKANYNRKAAL